VLGIIALCDRGQMDLLSSEALLYEGSQSTIPIRFEHTMAVLIKAKETISISDNDKSRAEEFISLGIKPLDALHLDLAEKGNADFFCTCDDVILRNAKRVVDLSVKVMNPVDLVQEVEK